MKFLIYKILNKTVNSVLNYLDTIHKNSTFTMKIEKENEINFLKLKILKNEQQI